jgi:imidazolonepropionase-like amidohydrolase
MAAEIHCIKNGSFMKKLHHSVMVAVTLLAVGAQALAQQSSTSVVIHAGHLLDVKTGKLLADQTLVIDDGKIVSVGSSSDIKAPADALRIELPNATVLPGLIDAHTHLTKDPKFGYERLAPSVPRETLTGATWVRQATAMSRCATRSTPATCPGRECW